jgi:hypothetical protein
MAKKTIFFAYEDGHQENRDAISRAAQDFNTHQKSYKVLRWEDLKNSGNIIGTRIFEEIRECEIFACDLTYLNHNVLFELGYAIASERKLKVFLNSNVANAKKNYSDINILRNVAYTSFSSSREINNEFQQNISSKSLLIKDIIPGFEKEEVENDVFFINIKNKNQAAIDIEEYLALLDNIKYISNNEDEIAYQPLVWYLKTIVKSNIVILHMVGHDKTDYEITNAEYSLYAGIALGLKKKLLLVAPSPFRAPIDYTDILVEYSSTDDCLSKIEKWIENCISELNKDNLESVGGKKTIEEDDQELNLLKLGIGIGVAEKEELSNLENFVEIDAYNESLNPNRKNIIIIGRKGSGKSEIFLRLNENLVSNRNNFIVIIKPDSDEILGNIELTNLYNNERTKRAFFATVWKYVIFSKIFQELIINIKELNLSESEEVTFKNYYQENKKMFHNNFYGMIVYISGQFRDGNIAQDIALLDKINERIRPMIEIVVKYFEGKKYKKIVILADNLDSGWNPKNNLELQSIMLNVLIEYIDRLSHDIRNNQVAIHSVIFLRKDIFNYILKDAQERDKLIMDSFEINWDRFPEQLNKVINNRMLSVLEGNEKIDAIWAKYFSFTNTSNPINKILNVIIKRPRDAIYFMGRLFESAINHNRLKVDISDFDYALEEYSKFLYNNLILELRGMFPKIEEILFMLQTEYPKLLSKSTTIPIEVFYRIIENYETNKEKIVKVLMEENYVLGMIKSSKNTITGYDELCLRMNEKFLRLFKRNKILLIFRLVPFAE